jgi:UDP-4-amino-4,6-dideoxy-N-acetyl-beta-L-altrosamine transaminase
MQKIFYGKHFLDEDDIASVLDVLRNGALTQGPKVEEFEAKVAQYVGAKYAVAVSSGTAALHIACLAANLNEESMVLTSPITFVASANCAQYVGAETQFADIDPETLNMSPEALRETCHKLKKVSAIIPVHFGGLPCDMPAISQIALENDAVVIEDASHALGGLYADGSRVGNCKYSAMTVFSFHPVKIIAAGEGGMITTNDEKFYKKLLRLRSHGINKLDDQFQLGHLATTDGKTNPWYYEMQELGFNYRITDIQSALGVSQMNKIDRFLARRKEIARRYDQAFAGHAQIKPCQSAWREQSALHLYVVRVSFSERLSRQFVMTKLSEAGINCQVHYIPVHLHPYYQNKGFKMGDFPNAEQYYQEALSIPEYYGLTDEQQQYVIDTLNRILA